MVCIHNCSMERDVMDQAIDFHNISYQSQYVVFVDFDPITKKS